MMGGHDEAEIPEPELIATLHRDARRKDHKRWTFQLADMKEGKLYINQNQLELLSEMIGMIYKAMRVEDERLAQKKPNLKVVK